MTCTGQIVECAGHVCELGADAAVCFALDVHDHRVAGCSEQIPWLGVDFKLSIYDAGYVSLVLSGWG